MTFAKLTASTAVLLLSSNTLMAQEAQFQIFQSVFIDVGGTAVLVPADVALEACGFNEASLQSVAHSQLQESGADQTRFFAQIAAMGMMGQGGAGDTTQTADTNMTTAAGNTTEKGNTTDAATADASDAAEDSVSGAAAGMEMTDTATADASGTAGHDATAGTTDLGDVQNVEPTAADTTSGAGAIGTANADPFIQLAACQIDEARATELQINMTQTGASLGFDAATLGIQAGAANQ